jgi:hypothetical protein
VQFRLFLLIGLAGGCHFNVDGLPATDDGPTPNAPDLASPPDMLPGFCDDPQIAGCWQFEDPPGMVARDGTTHHNDLTLKMAQLESGRAGGALFTGTGSVVSAPHTASLDVSQVTLEAWVSPLSIGGPTGVINLNNQYSLGIGADGSVSCRVAGKQLDSVGLVATKKWQHIACTYDQSNIVVYYQGHAVGTMPNNKPLSTNQPGDLFVSGTGMPGSEFQGLVDDVRISGVARAPAEICATAGGGC